MDRQHEANYAVFRMDDEMALGSTLGKRGG